MVVGRPIFAASLHIVPRRQAASTCVGQADTGPRCYYENSKTYPYPRGLAGPEIADFGGLNGPLLPQSPLEKAGGEAPSPFPMEDAF